MNRFKNFIGILGIIFLAILAAYGGYRLAFRNLIFPKVAIAGIWVGGMDKETALKLVENYFAASPNKVILRNEGKEITSIEKIKVERNFGWAVEQAYGIGRSGNILTQIAEQTKVLFAAREIAVPINYDADELAGYVDQLAIETDRDPIWPKLVKKNGVITVSPGSDGIKINKIQLIKTIIEGWGKPETQLIEVPTDKISAKEDVQLVTNAIQALNKWGDKKIKFGYKDYELTLSNEEMMAIYGLTGEAVNEDQFEQLLTKIKQQVETEPKDAVFVFEDNKVKEFKPEIVGVKVDAPALKTKLATVLAEADKEALEIPVIQSLPKVKTGDINNLGIKELIGVGKSAFAHSIAGRVFNINLAASRINGTLVAPGEDFSFNQAVGDISRASGYQSAYIISGGKTVLGDGGGVCQVSTTVFRAALNAGLPITERKAHAYRVGYYEQDSKPGIDATVYNPSADLKFTNDTGKYVLVQTKVDTKKMTMTVEIYGTKDGRVVTVSEPKISSQTPPPATVYVDDPTLPVGQTKQIDWSAWGAKVSFNYKVIKGEETVFEKTFYSNYQPWQAVYLRGTRS